MSDFSINKDLLSKLKERFSEDVIREREGADGKIFKYISTLHVAERLDLVFPLAWSWEVIDSKVHQTRKTRTKTVWNKTVQPWTKTSTEIEVDIQNLSVLGRLTITLPDGTKTSRDAWGGCELFKGGQAGDDYKIADSNAFKKAAYKFGVGTHIGLDAELDEGSVDPNQQNQTNNKSSNKFSSKKSQKMTSENPFLK